MKTFLLSLLFLTQSPEARVLKAPSIQVSNAQLRPGLPGVPDGVLYLTLRNTGKSNVKLLGGSTPVAESIKPMRNHSLSNHGEPLQLSIKPGGKLVFAPAGNHLMLVGLKRPPKVGEKIPVTLKFSTGSLTVTVPVKGY